MKVGHINVMHYWNQYNCHTSVKSRTLHVLPKDVDEYIVDLEIVA